MQPGSPAVGYGCYGFTGARMPNDAVEVALPAAPRRGSLDVGGPITVDTIWAADTVRVHSEVTVLDGVTLTVAAGALVEFQGRFGIEVQGRLLAPGDPDTRIRFDRNEVPAAADDGWRGITFRFTPETNEPSLLRFCEITHAVDADGGALTFVGFSRCRVENTILSGNTADRGGAVYCSHFAAPELVGCLLVGNRALTSGAALYCVDAYPRLVNCTVTGNVDLNAEPVDRAVAVVGMISKPALVNCIVWDNPNGYFLDAAMVQVKPFYVRYCDVEYGHEGEGNLAVDPDFVGSGDHPFRLMDGSFCVDAGSPDTTGLRLPALDLAGVSRVEDSRVDIGCFEGGTVICGVAPPAPIPGRLLMPNHPNPFNPLTTISFDLPERGSVQLEVLDIAGRRVRVILHHEWLEAGRHSISWNGRDDGGRLVPSGVYVYRLRAGSRTDARGMMLAR